MKAEETWQKAGEIRIALFKPGEPTRSGNWDTNRARRTRIWKCGDAKGHIKESEQPCQPI